MPNAETFYAFLVAAAIFAYMPGPAILYTAARTVAEGRRAGLLAAFGIHLGCYAHVFAAAFGLSAVFAQAPLAYAALKISGALYLAWLGVGMLRDALRRREGAEARGETAAPPPKRPQKSTRAALGESVVVELLNPKVAIFFIAFLPQFVDPAATLPLWAQFLALGVIVNAMFTSADLLTVLLADRIVKSARKNRAGERIAKALGGSALLGLGAQLAASRTP